MTLQAPGAPDAPGDTSRSDSIAVATREYRVHGTARTIVEGNFITFPYGHSQPTLTCTVLRACVIQLQPGEIVLSKITGDTKRWEITPGAVRTRRPYHPRRGEAQGLRSHHQSRPLDGSAALRSHPRLAPLQKPLDQPAGALRPACPILLSG